MRKGSLNLIFVLTLLGLALILSACDTEPATPTITATVPVPTVNGTVVTVSPTAEDSVASAAEDVSQTVAERTPVPTPTPGPVQEKVDDIAENTGLAGKSFLGLTTDEWINLGISFLIVLVGYFVGVRLLFHLLNRLVKRTSTNFDDAFLSNFAGDLKWFVGIILTRFAVLRLDFWSDQTRTLLDDAFFLAGLTIVLITILHLIDFAAKWYRDYLEPEENKKRFDPMIVMLKRLAYLFVSIICLSFALSHFGINITVLSAAIIFFALVIAIGAKAAVSDAISGFIILIDQPFRVGDAIFLKDLDTRGEVLEIGSRTTRIRTRDNREVIIPNSQIGESQVVNYAYPDPSFRVQTDIGVAYGTDMDRVRQVIQETVSGVEGVLPDKPVNVFFLAFGDSARQIRVYWWIDSVNHENLMLDRVNAVLESALDKAGIELPFTTYDLYLKQEGENGSRVRQNLSDGSEKGQETRGD